MTGIAVRGLDLGVEFTGGRLVEYSTSAELSVDEARGAVSDAGFPRAVVQESGEADLSVRTGEMTNDEEAEIRAALEDASGGEVTKERDELIGPSLGDELRKNALIALVVALLAQLAYLAIRFRWTLAAAAVAAMAHDVLVVGRGVRLAGQADRRRVPRRPADRHRLLGERLGRRLRPGARAVGVATTLGLRGR